jgi:prepilin-type N-terminal cleavage/methylation domain-containing protein
MRSRGFTLIELMVVIFIMGILMALASYSFRGMRQRVHRTSCRENLRILQQAAVLCQTEHPEFEKGNLTVTKLFQMGYLRRPHRCPTGGQYAITQEEEHVRVTCFKTTDGTDHGWHE